MEDLGKKMGVRDSRSKWWLQGKRGRQSRNVRCVGAGDETSKTTQGRRSRKIKRKG